LDRSEYGQAIVAQSFSERCLLDPFTDHVGRRRELMRQLDNYAADISAHSVHGFLAISESRSSFFPDTVHTTGSTPTVKLTGSQDAVS
jgi:hypothetical protein